MKRILEYYQIKYLQLFHALMGLGQVGKSFSAQQNSH